MSDHPIVDPAAAAAFARSFQPAPGCEKGSHPPHWFCATCDGDCHGEHLEALQNGRGEVNGHFICKACGIPLSVDRRTAR